MRAFNTCNYHPRLSLGPPTQALILVRRMSTRTDSPSPRRTVWASFSSTANCTLPVACFRPYRTFWPRLFPPTRMNVPHQAFVIHKLGEYTVRSFTFEKTHHESLCAYIRLGWPIVGLSTIIASRLSIQAVGVMYLLHPAQRSSYLDPFALA